VLRLFREQGLRAMTVDRIAEAAEVSPSTFFRYFRTKDGVVLQDGIDAFGIPQHAEQGRRLVFGQFHGFALG
jgi:AcrR family transcriptional regulator